MRVLGISAVGAGRQHRWRGGPRRPREVERADCADRRQSGGGQASSGSGVVRLVRGQAQGPQAFAAARHVRRGRSSCWEAALLLPRAARSGEGSLPRAGGRPRIWYIRDRLGRAVGRERVLTAQPGCAEVLHTSQIRPGGSAVSRHGGALCRLVRRVLGGHVVRPVWLGEPSPRKVQWSSCFRVAHWSILSTAGVLQHAGGRPQWVPQICWW